MDQNELLEVKRQALESLKAEMDQEIANMQDRMKTELVEAVKREQERQEEEKIMKDPIRAAFYRETERRRQIAERFFKKTGE